jgi:hypothetical protein
MQSKPSRVERERAILKKVVDRSKTGKGGIMGPYNPYQKTMVPVPPYMTTLSPTPSDSTNINYSRKEKNDQAAGRAISKYKQFDRAPRAKEKANGMVGKINDEKKLKGFNK